MKKRVCLVVCKLCVRVCEGMVRVDSVRERVCRAPKHHLTTVVKGMMVTGVWDGCMWHDLCERIYLCESGWNDWSKYINNSGWKNDLKVTAVKGALPLPPPTPLVLLLLSPTSLTSSVLSPCRQGRVARERGSEGRDCTAAGVDRASLAAFNSSSKE